MGTIEKGDNRGEPIETFQRFVHIPAGSPWCAAFISYCLSEAQVTSPAIRSGSARAFINRDSKKAADVLRGTKAVQVGDLVIFGLGSTYKGHIETVVKVLGPNRFLCVGGNTSCYEPGDPRNGGKVCYNVRSIHPRSRFRITDFDSVGYNEPLSRYRPAALRGNAYAPPHRSSHRMVSQA